MIYWYCEKAKQDLWICHATNKDSPLAGVSHVLLLLLGTSVLHSRTTDNSCSHKDTQMDIVETH